jgi:hypothetical protein
LSAFLRECEGAAPFASGRLPYEVPPSGQIGAEKCGRGSDNQQKAFHLENLLITSSILRTTPHNVNDPALQQRDFQFN